MQKLFHRLNAICAGGHSAVPKLRSGFCQLRPPIFHVKIEILHEAEEELNEAIAYYEEIEPGLAALELE
jgi:hypothetical protein